MTLNPGPSLCTLRVPALEKHVSRCPVYEVADPTLAHPPNFVPRHLPVFGMSRIPAPHLEFILQHHHLPVFVHFHWGGIEHRLQTPRHSRGHQPRLPCLAVGGGGGGGGAGGGGGGGGGRQLSGVSCAHRADGCLSQVLCP